MEFNANRIGGAPPLSHLFPHSDLSIMAKTIASTLGAVFVGTNIAGLYVLFSAPSASLMVKPTTGQTHRCCVHTSVDVFQTVSKG
jgi:hypothetical protein